MECFLLPTPSTPLNTARNFDVSAILNLNKPVVANNFSGGVSAKHEGNAIYFLQTGSCLFSFSFSFCLSPASKRVKNSPMGFTKF